MQSCSMRCVATAATSARRCALRPLPLVRAFNSRHHVLHRIQSHEIQNKVNLFHNYAFHGTSMHGIGRKSVATARSVAALSLRRRFAAPRRANDDVEPIPLPSAAASTTDDVAARGSERPPPPLPPTWQRLNARRSANAVVWLIVVANTVVFVLWKLASEAGEEWIREKSGGKTSGQVLYRFLGVKYRNLADFMVDNFLMESNRVKQALTGNEWWMAPKWVELRAVPLSAFSQKDFLHYLTNMAVLGALGFRVARHVGAARFIALYATSAVTCAMAEVYVHEIEFDDRFPYVHRGRLQRDDEERFFLGASGAVSGVAATYALTWPMQKLLLYGVVPVPSIILIAGLFTYDLWRLHANSSAAAAAASAAEARERAERRSQWRMPWHNTDGDKRERQHRYEQQRPRRQVAHLGHVVGGLTGALFAVLFNMAQFLRRLPK